MKLTEKQTKVLQKQLLQEKAQLEHKFDFNDHYGLSASFKEMTNELSVYDNHPADIATELYERGKDIALNENAEHQLEQINLALQHIQSKDYGICITCGKYIPFFRLKAIPTTQFCIKHVPNQHISQRRPVEEQILTKLFGNQSSIEKGEDAWQIVESYGNSDSPAMAENPNVDDFYDMNFLLEENEGYVEPIESFLATDLFGKQVFVVRNSEYRKYMANNEGDHALESDYDENPDDEK